MAIQESGEMYLETIYVLSQKDEPVRSLDVANYMNFSRPSVSRAMGILKSEGYIVVDDKGHITLTDKGTEIACKIYERHIVISKLLKSLGVDDETAADDACRIEHVISEKTFSALKEHMNKYGL